MSPTVDLNQAARFIAAITGEIGEFPARVTFQTFSDRKDKAPHLARILHGTLDEHGPELVALNEQGAGVFMCISETDLKGRKLENIIRPRAVFIDADGELYRQFKEAMMPDIIVRSSPGRIHAYWPILGMKNEEFTPTQKQFAAHFGSDPRVCDLTRVMRMAGFFHNKGKRFLVELERNHQPGPAVNPLAIVRGYYDQPAPTPPPEVAPPRPRTAPTPTIERRMLRASKYLETMAGAVEGQHGHDALWAATQAVVRGFSLPPGMALELLVSEYNPRCEPPWSIKDLEHKVKDATEKSQLADGYLLGDEAPPGRVSIGGRPVGAPAAAVAAEANVAEEPAVLAFQAAMAAGASAQELVIFVAEIRNEIKRDQAIKQVSHERHVVRSAVLAEVKKARAAKRKLRIVPLEEGGGTPPDALPEIRIQPGQLPKTVTEAEAALIASSGARVYQRGHLLVRVIRGEAVTVWRYRRTKERPEGEAPLFRRPAGALVIQPLDSSYLVNRFTAAADFRKWDARQLDWRPANCPPQIAEVYLSGAGEWNVSPLIGIIEAPTLRPDGSILETQGYDEETGLLYDAGETVFPPIPSSPTKEDAHAALERLTEILKGFPFVSPPDRAAALSAILTALVRKSIRTAPLHSFSAPKMRSGKSLLADVVAMMATGRPVPVLSQNQDNPEEEKKRILSILLAGDPVASFDNCEHPIGGATLCQALTQDTITDRLLGGNQMATAPTATMFLATGNNLVFEADVTSRVVPCEIDPQVERPEEREFDLNLLEYMPANRGELVVAALTVLRAYHVAGRPGVGVPRWGGFEEWSDWVRSSLVWLGEADCAKGRLKVEETDPERRQLRALLEAWSEAFPLGRTTVADAVKESNQPAKETLRDVFLDIAGVRGEINNRRLGNFISAHENRIEGGMQFVRDGVSHQAIRWTVKGTPPTPPPTTTPPEPGKPTPPTPEKGSTGRSGSLFQPISREIPNSLNAFDHGVDRIEVSPRNSTNSRPDEEDPFRCDDCSGSSFRRVSSGKRICTACWGEA